MSQSRLPILESFAAVISVGLVAGLVAFPSIQRPESREIQVMDSLGVLRTAIFRFSMEHSTPSGAVLPGLRGQDLTAQLTGQTRSDGSTEPSDSSRDDRWLGPYLKSIPRNPVNRLDTVRVVRGEERAILTGEAGWVYQEATGKVFPDLPGVDPRGVAYSEY